MTARCGVCGAPAPAAFRPPPAETAPDLDLRPGEPTRSTLGKWVSACRHCGACAPDLSVLTPDLAEVVASGAYRELTGPARRFLRWARLCADPGERAEAMLQAAWAADDALDAAAASYRREAAALWAGSDDPRAGMRRVDALRRAGDFPAALAALDGLAGNAEILAFQRARIAAGDTGRHLLSSALRPPARTPHAGHGMQQRAGRGLWRKLFGSA